MSLKNLLASITCAILLASYGNAAPAGSSLVSNSSSGIGTSSALATASSVATSTVWSSSGTEPSSTLSVVPVSATVAPASDDPNYVAWNPDYTGTPEATRGPLGSNVIGPQNVPLDLENPDLLAPPTTDNGLMYVHFNRPAQRYSPRLLPTALMPSGPSV